MNNPSVLWPGYRFIAGPNWVEQCFVIPARESVFIEYFGLED